jgi:hypothetical protein
MHRRHAREQKVRDETLIAGGRGSGCIRDGGLRWFGWRQLDGFEFVEFSSLIRSLDVVARRDFDARHEHAASRRSKHAVDRQCWSDARQCWSDARQRWPHAR